MITHSGLYVVCPNIYNFLSLTDYQRSMDQTPAENCLIRPSLRHYIVEHCVEEHVKYTRMIKRLQDASYISEVLENYLLVCK